MPSSFKIELGQRLRKVRESMNMTQKEFCLHFGPVVRSVSTVSEYESGDRKPPLELFFLLAQKGINLNWLLTGEESQEEGKITPLKKPSEAIEIRNDFERICVEKLLRILHSDDDLIKGAIVPNLNAFSDRLIEKPLEKKKKGEKDR